MQKKQILLIKRDEFDIPNFLQSKYTIIDARGIYIEESDTLKEICEWVECRHPWYFRLVILGFVHYRIMLVLLIYAFFFSFVMVNYFGDAISNKKNGGLVWLIKTLCLWVTLLILLYFECVCCFVALIPLCGCKYKHWKYYVRKRFTGRFIRHFLIFHSQDK